MKTMNVSITEEQINFIDKFVSEHDFANRSELIRVLIRNLKSNPEIIQPSSVQLSPKAIKRYNKMDEGIASGKEPLYVAKDIDDLLDQLHGRKSPVLAKVPKKLRKKNRTKQEAVKKIRRASSHIYAKPQAQTA